MDDAVIYSEDEVDTYGEVVVAYLVEGSVMSKNLLESCISC